MKNIKAGQVWYCPWNNLVYVVYSVWSPDIITEYKESLGTIIKQEHFELLTYLGTI